MSKREIEKLVSNIVWRIRFYRLKLMLKGFRYIWPLAAIVAALVILICRGRVFG